MRMRKKRHFDERLEESRAALIDIDRTLDPREDVAAEAFIDPREIFGNGNPVYLEVGCGKGKFAAELAKLYPDVNIIGVEKEANVIVDACKKAIDGDIPNLKFMICGAEYLGRYFRPATLSGIYLNFSCPFPKNTYAIHRLTHPRFLVIYEKLLADGAGIFQKTDNMKLFEFSIESFSECGFRIKNVTLDLHNSKYAEGNIMTEYETRFVNLGQPIYRLEAYPGGKK